MTSTEAIDAALLQAGPDRDEEFRVEAARRAFEATNRPGASADLPLHVDERDIVPPIHRAGGGH